MEKWEYSVITTEHFAVLGLRRVLHTLDVAVKGGMQTEKLGNFRVDDDTFGIDAPVLARLGNDGWELVAVAVNSSGRKDYFLKRRFAD